MKYIYTLGPWKEFYGYVFYDGKPTDVKDRATLEKIQKNADFQLYEETHNEEVEEEASPPSGILKGKECSKCHKLIPKGWYMHQKYCRTVS